MALRILLEIDKNRIKIVNHPSDNSLKRVIIDQGNAPSPRTIRVEDDTGSALTNPDADHLHGGANGETKIVIAALRGYAIDLPIELADRLNRYLCFKEKVRQAHGEFHDTLIDLRNLSYNGTIDRSLLNRFIGKCAADGKVDTNEANNTMLIIDSVKFGGYDRLKSRENWEKYFQFVNVDNGKDFDKNYKHASTPSDDFKLELDAFWETEELLGEITRYSQDPALNFPSETVMASKIKELKAYNCINSLGANGYKYDEKAEVELSSGGGKKKVEEILALDRTNSDNQAKIKELVKQAIYATTISGDADYYEETIEAFHDHLAEFELWKRCAGLNNIAEILKANANGFVIYQRNFPSKANVTIGEGVLKDGTGSPGAGFGKIDYDNNRTAIEEFFKDSPRKYRGFAIIEDGQVVAQSNNVAGKDYRTSSWLCLAGRAASPSPKISKENIDNFRRLFPENDKTTPEQCRGFSLGDIKVDANKPVFTGHGDFLNEKIKVKGPDDSDYKELYPTKNYFLVDDKIVAATGDDNKLNAALNQAFYAADFKETDNEHTREDLLELYMFRITGSRRTEVYTDKNKPKIDAAYAETKKLLELLNFNKDGKTEAQKTETKTKLVNHKTKFTGLATTIDTKIAEIDGTADWNSEVETAINGEAVDSNPRKVFEAFKASTDTAIKTKEVWAQLKTLVGFLKTTGVKKSNLKPFKDNAGETSPGDPGKAWKLAEQVQVGGEGWATSVWETAQEDDQASIDSAKAELKAAIKAVLGQEEDSAFQEIIKGIETSANDLKEAAKILKKALEGESQAAGSDEGNVTLSKLNELKKNTNAWSAAKKLKKAGRGYLEGIMEKLGKVAAEVTELIKKLDLDQVDDQTKLTAAQNRLKSESATAETKEVFEKKIFPRKSLVISIRKKSGGPSTEETELANLVNHFWKKFDLVNDSEYSQTDSLDQLTKLKGKLTELEKYSATGSGKTKAVFEALPSDQQAVITQLIKDIEDRVKAMETSQGPQHTPTNNPTEPNFWGTGWGIATIMLIVAVVLGGVVYFLKTNSSEEAEDEE